MTMKETLQNDLAAQVERLGEQVLDLGQQVVTLTGEVAALRAAPDTREAQFHRAMAEALSGAPRALAAAALVNHSASLAGTKRHLRVLPGGAR